MIWCIRIPRTNAVWYCCPQDYATVDHAARDVVRKLVGEVPRGTPNAVTVDVYLLGSCDGKIAECRVASVTVEAPYRKMTLAEWEREYLAAVEKYGSLAAQQAYEKARVFDYDALAERFRAALPK